MNLWLRKDIGQLAQEDASSTGEVRLRRILSATQLVLIGIGAIVGSGVFVITGQAAAEFAGPAVIFSFAIAALGCLTAGLCYAEFAAMIPVSGSAYTYAYATFGEFAAWIIGWTLILDYVIAAAIVAVSFSGYFVGFAASFGVVLPAQIAGAPLALAANDTLGWTQAIVNVPSVAILAVITVLLVLGLRSVTAFTSIVVGIKLVVLAVFVAAGAWYVDPANWHPFVPPDLGTPGHYGWHGVVRAAGVVFFSFLGFEAVSTLAQEARQPKRDIPIGIIGSVTISLLIQVAVALVLTGLIPYQMLAVPNPVAVAVAHVGPQLRWLGFVVNVGAMAGMISVMMVVLLAQSRVFYFMSRDGLISPVFGLLHPRFRTPHVGTLIIGAAAMLLAGLLPISILGRLISMGALCGFLFVCVGVLVLRITDPHRARPFRVPGSPFVPLAGIVTCAFMMARMPGATWRQLLVWLLIGLGMYALYGYRHSKLRAAVQAEHLAQRKSGP